MELNMENKYFYIYGNMGMSSSGSFTRDKNRWMTFSQIEVNQMENNIPYGATKIGLFVLTDKYK